MPTELTGASPPRAGDSKKAHIADIAITRQNWHRHVNWLNAFLIIGVPLYGCIQAFWIPLHLKTAAWAVFYYYLTGVGITAGQYLTARNNLPIFIIVQDIIDSGPIVHFRPLYPFASGSRPLVVGQLKALPSGGLVTIAPTTVIRILRKTRTPFEKAYSTRILAGWL